MSENEWNKGTPARPEPAPAEPKQKRKPRRAAVLVAVLVLAAAAGVLVLLRNVLAPGSIRQAAVRLGGGKAADFRFEEGAQNAYTAFHGGIAAITAEGMGVYDAAGSVSGRAEYIYAAPMLLRGSRLALGCDIGGTFLQVMDGSGNLLLDRTDGAALLDADISTGDAVCTAELAEGYRTVLSVYDDDQNRIYRWNSATRYFNQCAVSEDAEWLCATALSGSGSIFETKAVFFRTDLEEPAAELSLGSGLVWDLRFLNETTVCAVGENGVQIFDTSGVLTGSYDCGGAYLKDYSLEGSGFIALSVNKYQAGSRYSVVTLDAQGALIAEQYLGEEILSLSCAGEYLAVLTAAKLLIYDQNLNLCASMPDGAASAAVMREDGTALLISGGVGTLCIP